MIDHPPGRASLQSRREFIRQAGSAVAYGSFLQAFTGNAVAAPLIAPSARARTPLGPPYRPTASEMDRLRASGGKLAATVRDLAARAPADLVADVAIYSKAVAYILRFPEQFYSREYYTGALDLVADGLRRANELESGTFPWTTARGAVARGYRSTVDGSIQPYCVWVPDGYDPARPSRLDVILHGRSRVLNEVSFLTSARTGLIVATETGQKTAPDCLKLYVFGRGNNSYRWAGESDVFEALASVRSRYPVDPDRIVLRGFSMGGTGAWHLGLHFPSRWAAVEAGAGFVETRPEVLKTIHDPWCLEVLAIHDASNCAVNMTDVPFVAYVGSRDPQREQNNIIRRDLRARGIDPDGLPRARFLIGEGYGHNFRPDTKLESDALISGWLPRRKPGSFRFVAYTPSYGEFWDLHIDTLERLYHRAELSGTWDEIRTSNIAVLKLDAPRSLVIDGQRLAGAVFYKRGGIWTAGVPAGLRKRAGLQGPIDDAFQQPFLCVHEEGGPDPVLDQFSYDFARYLRGDIRIKPPAEVTAADIADYNLILFGDPADNRWIRKVLPGLPFTWTEDKIVLAGRTFPAATNTVAMIYPNPLNPNRYVVLNSGHTFPGTAFDDLHWFLYPRLGDYAVLDKRTCAVRLAGLFNKAWQIEPDEIWQVQSSPAAR